MVKPTILPTRPNEGDLVSDKVEGTRELADGEDETGHEKLNDTRSVRVIDRSRAARATGLACLIFTRNVCDRKSGGRSPRSGDL